MRREDVVRKHVVFAEFLPVGEVVLKFLVYALVLLAGDVVFKRVWGTVLVVAVRVELRGVMDAGFAQAVVELKEVTDENGSYRSGRKWWTRRWYC